MRGILTDEERAVIASMFEQDHDAEQERQAVLGQLRTVLEQANDAGLREESMQVITDVLGRAMARRRSVEDQGVS